VGRRRPKKGYGAPYIDAHRLKIQGRGYLMFFAKIPGGSRLSGKIAWGEEVPLFRVLLHFY
jgi:hypothetical protein